MRALFAFPGPNVICGPNVWLTRFLPMLRPYGIEPRVLYVSGEPDLPCTFRTSLQDMGIGGRVVQLRPLTEGSVAAIAAGIAAERPDFFVPNCITPAYFAARYAREAGVRTIGVMHSDDPFYHDILDLFVGGADAWRLDAMVTVSACLQEMTRAVAPQHMCVVQAGCGTPLPDAAATPPGDTLTLIYAGRLVEHQKRIGRVAERLSAAASRVPGVRAVLYGDGPDRSTVETILAERAASRVTLDGPLPPERMLEAMNRAHALVLLSDFEGLSIALLEAMASGVVPIVAPMRSGVDDLLRHDLNALIVDPDDEHAFVAAVRRLREEPGLWTRLSSAARQTIIDREMTVDVCARRWADLCLSLGPRRSPCDVRIPAPDAIELPQATGRPAGFEILDRRTLRTRVRLVGEAGRPLYVWGAGDGGRRFLGKSWSPEGGVAGFIDRRAGHDTTPIEGIPIHPPAWLAARAADSPRPFVVIASQHEREITRDLESFGFLAEDDFGAFPVARIAITPPLAVFVDHYASGPSGITTYAGHLASSYPALTRINLHAAAAADAAPRPNVIDVPPERSHDARLVADLFVESVRQDHDRRVVWLPNVGQVSWAGAWHALERLSLEERQRVRLLGIVHGDQASQYESMARYAPIIAGLAGVSQRCVDVLDEQAAEAGASPAALLHYPVPLPSQVSECRAGEPLRLLYAGRFEESQKRVSRLPDLFRALAMRSIPFIATLAGDGPDRANIEELLAALPPDTAARVTFLGAVPNTEMPALLRQHDVLLLVSAFEGTPLALLEAMAAGVCPVIMDLPGSLPELLDDGRNACVVAQGDIRAMADVIGGLDRDRARLAALKAAARATLERRGGPDAHAKWLLDRLDSLFEVPPPEPARVIDPDPLGRRVDRLVDGLIAGTPASVAIWGAGVVGRQIADRLLDAGRPPIRMVDSDAVRRGRYRGIRIDHPSILETEPPDVICVGSIAFAAEIARTLEERGVPSRLALP